MQSCDLVPKLGNLSLTLAILEQIFVHPLYFFRLLVDLALESSLSEEFPWVTGLFDHGLQHTSLFSIVIFL